MLVPLNWLTDFVRIDLPLHDLTHLLSMAGLEVEGVHTPPSLGDGFVIARVEAVAPHPGADRLRLVTVDDGQGGRTVVCGAPNVREGVNVILGKPGAVLPDGRALGEAKIRGVVSAGMLCSEKELGLGTDDRGLWIVDPKIPAGTSLAASGLVGGPVIEVSLTPNRPDCLSIRGIARELASLTGAMVSEPELGVEAPGDAPQAAALAKVDVQDGERCAAYFGRVIEGVRVGPSPLWLSQRLRACGIRPINNVVDASNYVMLELGQPLHAFDLDRVAGHRIVVRRAAAGEKMLFLDGAERALTDDDLVICDAERPVALAGVMGGEDSGVSTGTTRLLLESAYFEPLAVRRSAKRHGMHTDSSHRFERGVDPRGQRPALDRLAEIVLHVAGGRLAQGYVGGGPGPRAQAPIPVRAAAVSSLLGIPVDEALLRKSLGALGIGLTGGGEGVLLAHPPSARVDLKEEADLAEEVARMVGYDDIPTHLPLVTVGRRQTPPGWRLARQIEDWLGAQGLHQAVTYTFISPSWLDRLGLGDADHRRGVLRLLKPLSEELSVMRPVLVSSLLAAAAHNVHRQNAEVALFELGRVFLRTADGPTEGDSLGILMTGRRHPRTWDRHSDESVDFYDLKGLVEGLGRSLGLRELRVLGACDEPFMRPGHSAAIGFGERPAGFIGEVAPAVVRAFGLEEGIFAAELAIEALREAAAPMETIAALPSHPRVQRDLAVIVDRTAPAADMLASIRGLGEPLIEDLVIFDVYEGRQVDAGMKSIGFSITYRAPDRTLTEHEVAEAHARVLGRLTAEYQAVLRA